MYRKTRDEVAKLLGALDRPGVTRIARASRAFPTRVPPRLGRGALRQHPRQRHLPRPRCPQPRPSAGQRRITAALSAWTIEELPEIVYPNPPTNAARCDPRRQARRQAVPRLATGVSLPAQVSLDAIGRQVLGPPGQRPSKRLQLSACAARTAKPATRTAGRTSGLLFPSSKLLAIILRPSFAPLS